MPWDHRRARAATRAPRGEHTSTVYRLWLARHQIRYNLDPSFSFFPPSICIKKLTNVSTWAYTRGTKRRLGSSDPCIGSERAQAGRGPRATCTGLTHMAHMICARARGAASPSGFFTDGPTKPPPSNSSKPDRFDWLSKKIGQIQISNKKWQFNRFPLVSRPVRPVTGPVEW